MSRFVGLSSTVEGLAGGRVMVIGDVMLDRFVRGKVGRISPEAPVPVLRNAHEDVMLGGAGNVVRNITALGGHVVFGGVIGGDAAGVRVSQLVAADAQVTPILQVDTRRRTSEKTRFVADGHHLLRSDWDSEEAVAEDTHRGLVTAMAAHLSGVDVVILSDYGKGVFTPPVLKELIALAREAGKPVIVDPKSADYSIYRGATLVTPNRAELALAVGHSPRTTEEIVAAAGTLMRDHGIEGMLVTRSEEGMTLVRGDGTSLNVQAEAKEVFDVSGAGDTVVSVIATALATGADIAEAVELANVAAGLVVAKVGTAVVSPAELMHALAEQDDRQNLSKVLGGTELREQIARWRRRGLKVGFTNGCFDLIHPGHVQLLAAARATCDRLIVGLNSDASVRRLKGPERPIQDERSRAIVLAAFGSVDAVALFEDDTPLALITEVMPDVLIKGADYTIDQVVGADVVQAHGGRVALVELVPNQSTTGIAKRIRVTG
ncbi:MULTISPECIES: D-glycero-beta-D-manno-heptose-7-phosphate kinase [Nitrospirillum]|uniref:Bifunctional protein HldE n=1 Tax=Nitrospirillum amazonense TaxID=28077 RepID=A0A560FXE3_9PROT|nr:D-glycero-beta-D-manno-heptose-7-phosphate kinase [Nitrospirillum amazonense]MEC4590406.1 D-glycero-beta-D-manno-heptose-7-phosphate kinase [Nitrospirillum amazonense]TWB26303.1 D-alpha,beta-D-heptose 7-phosphate 1-kinase /D-beta-D-heptose 1-phosphate adenylyltransferase [Nitrospirillum amazonense]